MAYNSYGPRGGRDRGDDRRDFGRRSQGRGGRDDFRQGPRRNPFVTGDWEDESDDSQAFGREERSFERRDRESSRERGFRDRDSEFRGRDFSSREEGFGRERFGRKPFGEEGERERFSRRSFDDSENRFEDRAGRFGDRPRSLGEGRRSEGGFGSRFGGRFERRERDFEDRAPRRERFADDSRDRAFSRDDRFSRAEDRRGRFSREDRGGDRPGRIAREGRFEDRSSREDRFSRGGRDAGSRGPAYREGRPEGRSGFGGRFGRDGRRPEGGRFERSSFRGRDDRSFGRKRPGLNKAELNYNLERHAENDKKKAEGYVRLNKYIANAGICSRREADEMIATGVITVNGEICTQLGTLVGPNDKVQFGGQTLKAEKKVYLLMNKPKGYITTSDDPEDRKTVMDLLDGACSERIYPVGRLDRNTTGVLLFTNDGDMAKKLTHPSHGARKIYHVTLDKPLTHKDMQDISKGVYLEDGLVTVDEISYVESGDRKEVGVQLHSGKNRIVRRIFEHFGYEVVKLDRVLFAELTKKGLVRGGWRFLTDKEIDFLKMNVGKSVRPGRTVTKDQVFTPEQLAEAESIEEAASTPKKRRKRISEGQEDWDTKGDEELDIDALLKDMEFADEEEEFEGYEVSEPESEQAGHGVREIEVRGPEAKSEEEEAEADGKESNSLASEDEDSEEEEGKEAEDSKEE